MATIRVSFLLGGKRFHGRLNRFSVLSDVPAKATCVKSDLRESCRAGLQGHKVAATEPYPTISHGPGSISTSPRRGSPHAYWDQLGIPPWELRRSRVAPDYGSHEAPAPIDPTGRRRLIPSG